MTDDQIIKHYEHQARYEAKRVARYHSDPAYREQRRRQNVEAQRRRALRLRQMGA